jgi:hypothetical protein
MTALQTLITATNALTCPEMRFLGLFTIDARGATGVKAMSRVQRIPHSAGFKTPSAFRSPNI